MQFVEIEIGPGQNILYPAEKIICQNGPFGKGLITRNWRCDGKPSGRNGCNQTIGTFQFASTIISFGQQNQIGFSQYLVLIIGNPFLEPDDKVWRT